MEKKTVRFSSASSKSTRSNDDDHKDKREHDTTHNSNRNGTPSIIPTIGVNEHDLLQAKRTRRTRRVVGDAFLEDDDDDDREDQPKHNKKTRAVATSLTADGISVEPFHMDDERTDGSGYFDGDTYIFRKNAGGDDDEPDAWLDGLSTMQQDNNNNDDSNTSTTSTAIQRRQQPIRWSEPPTMDDWSKPDLYAVVLQCLGTDSETVTQALVRYGNLMKQQQQHHKQQRRPLPKRKREDNNDATRIIDAMDGAITLPPQIAVAQKSLYTLTEAANALLLAQGQVDIYQMKRSDIETLLQSLRPNTNNTPSSHSLPLTTTPTPSVPNDGDGSDGTIGTSMDKTVQWEYMGNQDEAIHGPFSTADMLAWIQAGYFVGPTAVRVRTVAVPAPPPSTRIDAPPPLDEQSIREDLLSDLLDDDEDDDTDNNGKVTSKAATQNDTEPTTIRGDWILSDRVDFNIYLS